MMFADIELTHRCNLNCSYCHREKGGNRLIDMPLDMFFAICDDLKKNGVKEIVIAGFGEALLHENIFEALDYADKYFERVMLGTNGLIMENEDFIKEVFNPKRKNFKSLLFSVTGFSHTVYNQFQGYHGGDSAYLRDKVYRNLSKTVKIRNALKSNAVIWSSYVYTKENKKDFLDYVNYMKNEVDTILISVIRNYFGENDYLPYESAHYPMPIDKHRCKLVGKPILIHADGDFSLCCIDALRKTVIGNVYKNKLSDLIDNEYAKMHSANLNCDFDTLPNACRTCKGTASNLCLEQWFYYSDIRNTIEKPSMVSKIKELSNSKFVIYAFNDISMRLLFLINLFCDNPEYEIVDKYKNGIYEFNKILRPDISVLKERKIIICTDSRFDEIEAYLHSLGLNGESYHDYMS